MSEPEECLNDKCEQNHMFVEYVRIAIQNWKKGIPGEASMGIIEIYLNTHDAGEMVW